MWFPLHLHAIKSKKPLIQPKCDYFMYCSLFYMIKKNVCFYAAEECIRSHNNYVYATLPVQGSPSTLDSALCDFGLDWGAQ